MRFIAVDAMGSDGAPEVELDAAIAAAREGHAGIGIILVGDEKWLEAGLAQRGARPGDLRLQIRHASQVVTMKDAPAMAVRQKKDSSMHVCFQLVKEGKADAVVSAGNSGAMAACATLLLGRLPGVHRPAIVTTFPTLHGQCVLCDMGANVEPRPENLAQFGILGATYAQVALGIRTPRVGLLSNGEEIHKGTELTRETHRLLTRLAETPRAGFTYSGYVEGRDIFSGEIDVVATDGFTGNVVLKTAEGAALTLIGLLKRSFESSARARLGGLLARPALMAMKKQVDYSETGGAPLLGVNGLVTICHGGSNAHALKNAILTTGRHAQDGLKTKVADAISRQAAVWSEAARRGDAVDAPMSLKGSQEG